MVPSFETLLLLPESQFRQWRLFTRIVIHFSGLCVCARKPNEKKDMLGVVERMLVVVPPAPLLQEWKPEAYLSFAFHLRNLNNLSLKVDVCAPCMYVCFEGNDGGGVTGFSSFCGSAF